MARVLIVDDSPNQRSKIVGALARAGHEVLAAEDLGDLPRHAAQGHA